MTKIRVLVLFSTLTIIILFAYLFSLYARGYRFNRQTWRFSPSGLLVVKSNPDAAQIFIDNEVKGVTNNNISLAPGTYDVTIKKEGYYDWYKRLTITKEIVTEASIVLFKKAPSLSAITFSGSIQPTISSDFSKIAYMVPATTENVNNDKEGLWVIETINLPLGFSRDPKRITDGNLEETTWQFSPNSREILLNTQQGKYLLDSGTFTPQGKRINLSSQIETLLKTWQNDELVRLSSQIRSLPEPLKEILKDNSSKVIFSSDETKILYLVSSDFTLPEKLIPTYPGASTQKEERELKANRAYVYDTKEDRNFFIGEKDNNSLKNCQLKTSAILLSCDSTLTWLPTSGHLLLTNSNKITIMDYDGTNRQEIYSGTYSSPFAFPVASTDRILFLTNLGASDTVPNLYYLGIK